MSEVRVYSDYVEETFFSSYYSLPTLLDFLTRPIACGMFLAGFVEKAAVKNTLRRVIKKDSFFNWNISFNVVEAALVLNRVRI